jgi:NAD(P)-dependent dehydrogenase (short-subunit alcohol dehydrogenase family)
VAEKAVILLTGCSSGIGRASALALAARGHRVFATARKKDDLAGLERDGLTALPLDVTEPATIAATVEAVLSRAGRLDVLVNNAGYPQYGSVEEVTLAQWRAQFDVNVFGTLAVTQAVLPAMRKQLSGRVINVSSVAGKLGIPFAAPYCASKHALEALSDALRVEVSPFGIRVVLIEPGPVETRFGERARSGVASLLSRPGPYQELYKLAERAMNVDFQRGNLPAEAVAKVIVRASEAASPRTRYTVGIMARAYIALRRALPDRWLDAQMRRTLRMPSPP